MPTPFELLYYDSLHYDAIICETTGESAQLPQPCHTITVD